MGCQVEIDLKSLTPAVVNNKGVTKVVLATAKELWPQAAIASDYATMGSEDMAFYLKEVPGCFIFIGSANDELGLNAAHHHPRFDIDERVIPMAAGLIAATVENILGA